MASTESITILLVDDDPAYCEFLSMVLTGYGFRVLVAHSGEAALGLADQADLALIDMIMPGLSGIETIPLVRERNPDLRVIACSGCEDCLFRPDLDRLEVERFVGKPFPMSVLIQEIEAEMGTQLVASAV